MPKRLHQFSGLDGKLQKILLLPFALATVLFFALLRPIILIQIHRVWEGRIGHFATNAELTRLKTIDHNKRHRRKLITIYYFKNRKVSNQFLSELWRRNLPSITGHWGWLLNDIASHSKNMNSSASSTEIDLEGLLLTYTIPPTFTELENLAGQEFVQTVCPNGKFVCLHVRDNSYLKNHQDLRDWSYHNYRDTDIKTYAAAAEALAEMGYTVFRMGAIVKEPLVSKYPRVIDYATNGMRTEFLDVYLGANCAFTVSVGSGWDSVPTIFRRPILFVNYLPIFVPSLLTLLVTAIPKLLLDKKTNKLLTLNDAIERNVATVLNTKAYEEAGVEIRDLSSEELVEAVTEMAARVEGTFVETEEQKQMQQKLKNILTNDPRLQPSPGYYPIRAEFASCFLSRYTNFLS